MFLDVKFLGETYFRNVKFYKTDFFRVTFHNSVKFIGKDENKIFKSSVDFSGSNFEEPKNVEFVNVNLSKASFLHCKNIDKIGRFEKVKWNEEYGRKAVYYEIKLKENKEKDKPYEYVEEVYRKLRINYERNLRFSEAGDFYIG